MFASRPVATLAVVGVLVAIGLPRWSVAQTPSAVDGIYTSEQADRGAELYDGQCIACHGSINQLIPEMATLLADHTFRARWEQRSLGEFFDLIQVEMPQDSPGSLADSEVADVLAFILRGNRRPEGQLVLSSDSAVLAEIPFAPGS